MAILLFFVAIFFAFGIGCVYAEKSWKYYYPDYAQEDISALLLEDTLTEEEYDRIYRQTGLTRTAVEDMRGDEEGRARILRIQQSFFSDFQVKKRRINLFSYVEELDGAMTVCRLQDGDILLSASTFVSWWRYGHAAIVVDGEHNLIAECAKPNSKSKITTVESFAVRANFLVLRPTAERKTREAVAKYVREELLGVKYRLTTGVFSKKNPKSLKGTQCAHFVWYAYKKFGVDLDGNGGKVVKPRDIAKSQEIEVVQAFGFHLDKLWS